MPLLKRRISCWPAFTSWRWVGTTVRRSGRSPPPDGFGAAVAAMGSRSRRMRLVPADRTRRFMAAFPRGSAAGRHALLVSTECPAADNDNALHKAGGGDTGRGSRSDARVTRRSSTLHGTLRPASAEHEPTSLWRRSYGGYCLRGRLDVAVATAPKSRPVLGARMIHWSRSHAPIPSPRRNHKQERV